MSKTTDTTLEETRLHHSIVHGLLKSLAGIYFNDIHQKVIMQFLPPNTTILLFTA